MDISGFGKTKLGEKTKIQQNSPSEIIGGQSYSHWIN
jgi:hypothetical protein